jgi:hypothetical protein
VAQSAKTKARKPAPKKVAPVALPVEAPTASVASLSHNYVAGSKVTHPMFGDGTVTAVDLERLTIKFKGGREKLIVAAFVKPR